MRYQCIHRRREQHSVRMMCRLPRVSRSGYYDWSHRGETARQRQDRELMPLVHQAPLESRGVYGARKIDHELRAKGEG